LLASTLGAGAALAARRTRAGATPPPAPSPSPSPSPAAPSPSPAAASPSPAAGTPPAASGARGRVVVPNGSTLPWTTRDGVKIFHLRAEPLKHVVVPGLEIEAWGYNGATPGPLLEATEGDRVRIYVTNKLPDPTSIHWHGVFVPNGMDGVGGLTQPRIAPGKTFKYEFTFDRAGTFMYHPHVDEMTQIALGMMGMIVVHPRGGEPRRVRDYALMTHEMTVPIGTRRPDPLAMNDFNVLTFNGVSFPATEPLVAETGDLVRIRIGNLGPMDHHPIHLHGHAFEVVATDGGVVPPSARFPETAVLVPVGTVRVIEFIARAPGDWALHCHMTHHAMNQMGHGAANLVGADASGIDDSLSRVVPGYMTMGTGGMSEMSGMAQPVNSVAMMGSDGPHGTIDMGGMFTLLKVRDSLATKPGWYSAPTMASEASATDLRRDGIE
jgi:FtsP/CotA-like multicopper oxidase with cupredoxin domain